MSERNFPHPTQVKMFQPGMSIDLAHEIVDYYGPFGWNYLIAGLQGRAHEFYYPGQNFANPPLDDEFFSRFQKRYEIADTKDAQRLYGELLVHANEAVRDVITNALPDGFEDLIGLRNTVAIPPNIPSDRLHRLGYSGIDSTEAFEIRRQLLLAEVGAHIRTKSDPQELRNRTYDLQTTLDRYLYSQPGDGAVKPIKLHILHDDETNHYKGIYDGGKVKTGTHIKDHYFAARQIVNGSPTPLSVLTQTRIKPIYKGINKAAAKAMRDGKPISPDNSVRDKIGIAFTTITPDPRYRDILVSKVEGIMENYLPDLVDITEDNHFDGRTDSNGNTWRRLNVTLQGVCDPIELVFYDLATHVNCRFNLGRPGQKGIVNRAHKIFEFQRSVDLLPLYFPYSQYQEQFDIVGDINEMVNKKYSQVRQSLLDTRKSFVQHQSVFDYDHEE